MQWLLGILGSLRVMGLNVVYGPWMDASSCGVGRVSKAEIYVWNGKGGMCKIASKEKGKVITAVVLCRWNTNV
ncbi:hypothetical protein J3E72DRAFT_343552 [Bipolaris maydis]|uniref:uncharacterized protein n=1 Tax=Cochliobolus heterostrophus TaxID=5016 RepID=UPI0024D739AC|nr:hypothetical protein J3E73DRAFT_328096 [Bipolaris maydis]KAJ5057724.1 hypothetical protein J3E74DRAFT_364598 [Bipolaris maydis]KAJ6194976.1 hypothetical protein J3E72DRAFT_343552 [Bipolaris maydis]KAJ6207039.1 hypothetical protein PSV09DRAFT_2328957 [Bipolaris maydis]KAJ6268453.1 hypothetical protein PSV08DRAFT_318932 [Bipolaris maydis]